jgi:hypothetical protein
MTRNTNAFDLSLCSLSDAIRSSYLQFIHARSRQMARIEPAGFSRCEPGQSRVVVRSMARSSPQEIAAVAGNRGAQQQVSSMAVA